MTAEPGVALHDLRAIVGAEHVRPATPDDAVDGAQPRLVVEPGDPQQVAGVLQTAGAAGLTVAPRGGATKLSWGNPPRRVDLIVSTWRLNRVVEHAWGDMTATVQTGRTVAQLQQTLAEHGQRLALDPLWPERATIGGILATNDSGVLRLRFGSLRDQIIGITVALPDGTLAKSGGKVVKNVAGYDLPKLFTGSLGTLGVIVEATFRLYPLPHATRWLGLVVPTAAAMNDLVQRILDSTLAPVGVQATAETGAPLRVDVLLEGSAAALDAQAEELTRLAGRGPRPRSEGARPFPATDRGGIEVVGGRGHPSPLPPGEVAAERRDQQRSSQIRHPLPRGESEGEEHARQGSLRLPSLAGEGSAQSVRESFWDGTGPAIVCKISVLPAELRTLCGAVESAAAARRLEWKVVVQATGTGLVRLAGGGEENLAAAAAELRADLGRLGGSLVVLGCPLAIKARLDAWGDAGDALPLMRRVKAQFDPGGVLNPGRFVGGI